MIDFFRGNLLEPILPGTNRLIIHCCNNLGYMGGGVALQIRKKWPIVYDAYRAWNNNVFSTVEVLKSIKYLSDKEFDLGNIQVVKAEKNIYVCNLIGQKGVGYQNIGRFTLAPVRYEALYEGFLKAREWVKSQYQVAANNIEWTFHLPMIGAGLAGGDWNIIFEKYKEAFKETNSRTIFYANTYSDYNKMLEKITLDKHIPPMLSVVDNASTAIV